MIRKEVEDQRSPVGAHSPLERLHHSRAIDIALQGIPHHAGDFGQPLTKWGTPQFSARLQVKLQGFGIGRRSPGIGSLEVGGGLVQPGAGPKTALSVFHLHQLFREEKERPLDQIETLAEKIHISREVINLKALQGDHRIVMKLDDPLGTDFEMLAVGRPSKPRTGSFHFSGQLAGLFEFVAVKAGDFGRLVRAI